MYRGYVKIAFRSLRRNKLISAINILGLAVGMSVALLLCLWVVDELSFNRDFDGHDRIARVLQYVSKNGEVTTWRHVPYPLAAELRKDYASDFELISNVYPQYELLSFETKVSNRNGKYAERDFFKLFSIKLICGSENQLQGTTNIFLSQSAAKAYFGSADPLGKAMTLKSTDSDPMNVLVAGIYQDFPIHSDMAGTDYIAPWDIVLSKGWIAEMEDQWTQNFVELYVKIKDLTSFEKASMKIKDAKLRRVDADDAKMKPELFLHPMDDWHLRDEFKNGKNAGGRIQYVWLFGAIGIFILLMACINFMNLTTARSERRSREVGVRKSIGSLRKQLIALFFTESLLVTLLAFAVTLLSVLVSLPFFNALAHKHIYIPLGTPMFWVSTLFSCLVIALVCGSYPAIYLSSINAIDALKGSYRSGKSAATLRRALVVVQFTVSVVLIVVTITVTNQIEFAMNRPVGYDRAALVTVPVRTNAIHAHFDTFTRELTSDGSVISVAEASAPPTARYSLTTKISWPGKDPNTIYTFAAFPVSQHYGQTVGWKIKYGEDFPQDMEADTASIVINEAAMEQMGLQDPVGSVIQWWGDNFKVIGVVDNMMHESPYQAIQPSVYTLLNNSGVLIIRLNSFSEASTALEHIERTFKEFNSEEPFTYQFVEDEYARKFDAEKDVKRLTTIFSALAIVISCLGLLGLVSYVAEQRKKEIGIRKVMGASALNIWMMLSKDFAFLVVISGVIAIPLGYYLIDSWLANYEYRITFTWFIFVEAFLSVMFVTLLTASYQTIATACKAPAESLRSE
ncbi:ABC transporter permease [Chryseolinea sp. H1M3-3]|uniref:ABC transporter permease n=1 Tax=Chryseolinea sp. H1M3-3 TaxID=3034144 RepID=UPI0023EB072E|nr:ABC transporter permease [Chryseolinea sp. H1M3-3]